MAQDTMTAALSERRKITSSYLIGVIYPGPATHTPLRKIKSARGSVSVSVTLASTKLARASCACFSSCPASLQGSRGDLAASNMGANQSSQNGPAGSAEVKTSYYELLGVERDATDDEYAL
jgi:hypothetical protein